MTAPDWVILIAASLAAVLIAASACRRQTTLGRLVVICVCLIATIPFAAFLIGAAFVGLSTIALLRLLTLAVVPIAIGLVCRALIRKHFAEPDPTRCHRCGYDTIKAGLRCPECGEVLPPEGMRKAHGRN